MVFGDNIIVTANGDHSINVWNTEKKEIVKTIEMQDKGGNSSLYSILQIDRQGTVITGSSSGDIVASDYLKEESQEMIKTFLPKGELVSNSGAINDLHMISVGELFCSASYAGFVRIWDFESGRCKSKYEHSGKCICAHYISDFRWLFSGAIENPRVRAWDVVKGVEVVTIYDHLRECSCIWGEHERNLVVTGSKDRTFKLWDLKNMGKFTESVKLKNSIYSCYMSQSRPFLYVGDLKGAILKYDIRKLKTEGEAEVESWKPHSKCVWRIKPVSPHKFVSCSDDSTIFVWDHEGKQHAKMVSSSYVYGICGKYKEVFDRMKILQMEMDDRDRRKWLIQKKGEYFSFQVTFTAAARSGILLIQTSKSLLLL